MRKVTPWWLAGALVLAGAGLAGCGGSAGSTGSHGGSASNSSSLAASAKQLFPNGLIIEVGFGPGGANDIAARLAQPYLQKALGVPVTVINKAGAAGNVAAAEVYHSSDTNVIMPAFLPTLPLEQMLNHGNFDGTKLTAVYGLYGNDDELVYSHKGSPLKTVQDLEHSNKTITAAVSGLYNSAWLALAELSIFQHVHVQIVPFSSGAESTNAVLGGAVDITSGSTSSAVQAEKSGKAQMIVQFGPSRNESFPNVPTIVEEGGSPQESYLNEIGFYGPPTMSAAQVRVLDAAFDKVAANPDFVQKAKAEGLAVEKVPHDQFVQHVKASYQQIQAMLPQLQQFASSKPQK